MHEDTVLHLDSFKKIENSNLTWITKTFRVSRPYGDMDNLYRLPFKTRQMPQHQGMRMHADDMDSNC